ncbi:thioredoxin reductase [Bernardetia litoralis DSM 6794]|uniref:Thioredoxin reductase n=1 Tax=Bernardetia litoralis (strain ATCC 23117 / DSM 6794 / NBRC 15988 / NCIMB 1366 / Fx l1 / Sio-4) TaxID=880071 RepID=I4ALD6_BERLS|nr:NAD(P)/FAD-dependent oxidoreductase [Bernardetia litoralis]AFM04771.1 thioredoxin reductase [Bernardetia litoralis DSM 6794]
MENNSNLDVIIIGGSYAGLSAAMALGRSLRKVLIIDSGKPCNRQTPHSHNFITQDGNTPKEISSTAKEQVLNYPTVQFLDGKAISCSMQEDNYEVFVENGNSFFGKKILFATGVKDIMPSIKGFTQCWGISILHCPYCHGYEVKHENIGVMANGDTAFEMSKLIYNWSKNLTLFTNGKSTLNEEQTQKLHTKNIKIIETKISEFEHQEGQIQNIIFTNKIKHPISAIFSRVNFEQHSAIPKEMGCKFDENGFIEVDLFKKTSVKDIFAVGDATTMFRAVSFAVASGTIAGAFINRELIEENF